MSKEPSYIRCIKPNEWKMSTRFDEELVAHQVKYLGLMENLRIRRAGFAYRRPYTEFIKRYKPISDQTWPNWNGPLNEGASAIIQSLGLTDDDYKLGKTKIFIRHPKTVFELEEQLNARKHQLATQIQAKYKAFAGQKKFQNLKQAQINFSKVYRGRLARIEAENRKKAVVDIRKFILGFKQRHQPVNEDNKYFVQQVRLNYLKKVQENLPDSILRANTFPDGPPNCVELKNALKDIWVRNWLNHYCKSMTDSEKLKMEEKLQASNLFRQVRADYDQSVGSPFVNNRTSMINPAVNGAANTQYKCEIQKIDNSTVKVSKDLFGLFLMQDRLVTSLKGKMKRMIPYNKISSIQISNKDDNLVIIQTENILPDKKLFLKEGDLVINLKSEDQHLSNVIEFVIKLSNLIKQSSNREVEIKFINDNQSCYHGDNENSEKKTHTIIFEQTNDYSLRGEILVNKQKQLQVFYNKSQS